jgi:16S rRNA (guanine527-N7)-methyltransferase
MRTGDLGFDGVEALLDLLGRAQALGFLGPGPVQEHLDHAAGYLPPLADVTGLVVDLGSGGGIPGLVLAVRRPDLDLHLVDAMARRCRFLEEAVRALGSSATVHEGRAEDLGRGPLRYAAAAVVARSFGPPATTAECAAPLLVSGGLLIVSEPPSPTASSARWSADGLALLGLEVADRLVGPPALQLLRQTAPCPDRYPRRVGVPGKRPLF